MSPTQSYITICLLILLSTSLEEDAEGDFVVERYDSRDVVHWPGIKDCNDINGYPPNSGNCSSTVLMQEPTCCCNSLNSFTTLTGKCELLYDKNSGGKLKANDLQC